MSSLLTFCGILKTIADYNCLEFFISTKEIKYAESPRIFQGRRSPNRGGSG